MTEQSQHGAPLDELRRRRAELREAMGHVERAVAAPVADRPEEWLTEVRARMAQLRDDFGEHLEVTQGPEGMYQDLQTTAPRLVSAVERLRKEHVTIGTSFEAIDGLLDAAATDRAGIDPLRASVTELLGLLARHRQRGSDLVWEAYTYDLGGET